MKKSLPFMFYFFYYAAASFILPFIVLYFQSLGFSGPQIGLLAGLIPLVSMIGAPFWTRLADARSWHRWIMGLTMLGAVIFTFTFPFLGAFPLVLVVSVLFAFFSSAIISFADSTTMNMLGAEKHMYGRIRLGGTIGWGLAAPVAGLIIQGFGLRWAFWGYALIMSLALIISQKFTFAGKVFPVNVEEVVLQGGMRQFLASRRWIQFLLLAFIAGVGLATINSFLFPYMEDLKISRFTMEISLTIATLGELPVLFFANRLLKRFGAYNLLVMGIVITGIRLLLYAWLNTVLGILAFQLLNGMTFPLIWVAGVSYANEHAPHGLTATAQGLFGAMIFGVGAAIGGFFAGLLLESLGGRGMYLIFGALELVAVALIILFGSLTRSRQGKATR